jgi:hypothetical protein
MDGLSKILKGNRIMPNWLSPSWNGRKRITNAVLSTAQQAGMD